MSKKYFTPLEILQTNMKRKNKKIQKYNFLHRTRHQKFLTGFTTSAGQTKKLAENFAQKILKSPLKKKAIVIGLIGDLGSGKTTFLQGFAKGLGIKEKILSPSFVIMKKFSIINFQFSNFYHIDCYRINKPKEILDLGFKKIILNPENIVAIEWADRVKRIIPKGVIWIKFELVDQKTRKITIISNIKSQKSKLHLKTKI